MGQPSCLQNSPNLAASGWPRLRCNFRNHPWISFQASKIQDHVFYWLSQPLGSRQVVQHAVLHAVIFNFWIKIYSSSEKWVAKNSLNKCLHSHRRPSRCQPQKQNQHNKKQQEKTTEATNQTKKGHLTGELLAMSALCEGWWHASSPELVWQKAHTNNTEHHITRSPYPGLWEQNQNSTVRKPGLPPSQEPRDHTEQT